MDPVPNQLASQEADTLVATFQIGARLPQRKAFALQAKARKFWRLSDKAGHAYPTGLDALGLPVLNKHEREQQADFKRRQAVSKVRRYVRSIIDRYNDHACRQPVKRPEDGSPDYQALLEDADGSGTPFATLMRRALRKSQIEGTSYLLADTTAPTETPPVNAAQEIAGKVRPIIRRIKADQVIWWADWNNELTEALILMSDRDGTVFAWYVTAEIVQRIDFQMREQEMLISDIGDEKPHTYGGCPLVRLAPVFDDDDDPEDDLGVMADSQAAPIAEAQKRIFHLDSILMEELENCTFTTWLITGLTAEQLGKVTLGSSRVLCIPQVASRLDKLGSDVEQADSLRKSMMDEIADLYRVAGLSPGNPLETGAPESGVAKAFAFNEVEAKLSALADAAEAAENKVMRRACAGSGIEYPGDATWPESFESPDLAAELDFTVQTLSSQLPDVLKKEQITRYASQAYKLDDQAQEELETAVDAYVTPPATTFPADSETSTSQPGDGA